MKNKLLASLFLVTLLTVTLCGCQALKDLKAGRDYCKANPLTCYEPAKVEGKALGDKVTATVSPLITTVATPIVGAPIASAAGTAGGAVAGLLLGWIAAEIKAAFKGKQNKKDGVADPVA